MENEFHPNDEVNREAEAELQRLRKEQEESNENFRKMQEFLSDVKRFLGKLEQSDTSHHGYVLVPKDPKPLGENDGTVEPRLSAAKDSATSNGPTARLSPLVMWALVVVAQVAHHAIRWLLRVEMWAGITLQRMNH